MRLRFWKKDEPKILKPFFDIGDLVEFSKFGFIPIIAIYQGTDVRDPNKHYIREKDGSLRAITIEGDYSVKILEKGFEAKLEERDEDESVQTS